MIEFVFFFSIFPRCSSYTAMLFFTFDNSPFDSIVNFSCLCSIPYVYVSETLLSLLIKSINYFLGTALIDFFRELLPVNIGDS